MREPSLNNLKVDEKGTKAIRKAMSKTSSVKITVNIDSETLDELRSLANENGIPYQRLLNQSLKDGLKNKTSIERRVAALEKQVKKLKTEVAS
jgi:predicted DNA binding CopG/RHH family protein